MQSITLPLPPPLPSCLWNGFCFLFVARSIFPNFWFERGLVLTADALGHSYCGLLFARTLDPSMESPVPAAYAYKLMLFFIPSRYVIDGRR